MNEQPDSKLKLFGWILFCLLGIAFGLAVPFMGPDSPTRQPIAPSINHAAHVGTAGR